MSEETFPVTHEGLKRLCADITKIAFDQALLHLQKTKDTLEFGGVENGAYWVGTAIAQFLDVYRLVEADPIQALWEYRLNELMHTALKGNYANDRERPPKTSN